MARLNILYICRYNLSKAELQSTLNLPDYELAKYQTFERWPDYIFDMSADTLLVRPSSTSTNTKLSDYEPD